MSFNDRILYHHFDRRMLNVFFKQKWAIVIAIIKNIPKQQIVIVSQKKCLEI